MIRKGFRNNMNNSRFNLWRLFNIFEYKDYITALKDSGAIEIEHVGKALRYRKQRQRAKDVIKIIHDLDMKAILYTGIFGTVDATKDKQYRKLAQRDQEGNLLSYGKLGKRSVMMCPSSRYVEELVVPQILRTLEFATYDGVFLDIPWIIYGGCYCKNCDGLREEAVNEGKNQAEINAVNVREGLERFVTAMKKEHPNLKISVNVSAPTIYSHAYHGAEIDNLAGLFDQYVTEWNPLRVGQRASVVTRCVKKTIEVVEGIETIEGVQEHPDFYHATTCTDTTGKVYSAQRLSRLFHAILEGGALPRLGVAFPTEQLEVIKDAWQTARQKYEMK